MKTLLLILLPILSWSQCLSDSIRNGYYNYSEVLNHTTNQYEKFRNKTGLTDLHVVINTDDRWITFKDSINNQDQKFEIISCIVLDTALIYRCINVDNNQKCDMIFNADDKFYKLMIIYMREPVICRIKRKRK